MAIPKFLDDLNIISKLGDDPRVDNGLSTNEFRAIFDKAALLVQAYINTVLLPELDKLVDVEALLESILDTTLSAQDKAANAQATGEALRKKLNISGGSMTGILNMNSNRVTNLPQPVNAADAANKEYVDGMVQYLTATLIASGWTGEGPYTQTVAVPGVSAAKPPHVSPVLTLDNFEELAEACSCVSFATPGEGSITFICREVKPDLDIPVQVEVHR